MEDAKNMQIRSEIDQKIDNYEEKLSNLQKETEIINKTIDTDKEQKKILSEVVNTLNNINKEINTSRSWIAPGISMATIIISCLTFFMRKMSISSHLINYLIVDCIGITFGAIPTTINIIKIKHNKNKKQKILHDNNLVEDEINAMIEVYDQNISRNKEFISQKNIEISEVQCKLGLLFELFEKINNIIDNQNVEPQGVTLDEVNVNTLTDEQNKEFEIDETEDRKLVHRP